MSAPLTWTYYCWDCHAYSTTYGYERCGACGRGHIDLVTPSDHPDRRDPFHNCPKCGTPGMQYSYWKDGHATMTRTCPACNYVQPLAEVGM